MRSSSDALSLIGRVMLAAVFVTSGIGKVSGFQGLVGAITSKGLPMGEVFAVATIIIEVGVALLLVAGWRARWAAFVLAVFTVVVTVLFIRSGQIPEAQKAMQQINSSRTSRSSGAAVRDGIWSRTTQRGQALKTPERQASTRFKKSAISRISCSLTECGIGY